MRLSGSKKDEIQHEILSIYNKPEQQLKDEENDIVVANYLAWIPQYEVAIAQLPEDMVHRDKSIVMDIPHDTDPDQRIARWYGVLPEKSPVIKSGSGYYADTQPTPIMEVTQNAIDALLIKLEKLANEKRTLRTFIEECLEKVTTTKQLRELWADYPALAKHIPPEPVRAKKSQQQVLDLDSKLDLDVINRRITHNMLEG